MKTIAELDQDLVASLRPLVAKLTVGGHNIAVVVVAVES